MCIDHKDIALPHPEVTFHSEYSETIDLQEDIARQWIIDVITRENKQPGTLAFIFCDDEYLQQINRKYLNHHDLTDIITFDYTDELESISGDIFISYERVRENANILGLTPDEELYRVMIHGVLHLLGYKDSTYKDKELMREKENYYLSLRQ